MRALILSSSPSLLSTCVHRWPQHPNQHCSPSPIQLSATLFSTRYLCRRSLPLSAQCQLQTLPAIDTWVLFGTEHVCLTLGTWHWPCRPDIGLVRGSDGRGSAVKAYSILRRCALRTLQLEYDIQWQIPDLTNSTTGIIRCDDFPCNLYH